MRRFVPIAAWCLHSALVVGCTGDQYQPVFVTGKVTTCEGQPARGGVITFNPIDDPKLTGRPQGNPGRASQGTIAEDGTFTLATIDVKQLPGALTGRHSVTFEMPPTKRPVLLPGERAVMTEDDARIIDEKFAQMPVYKALPCSAAIAPAEVTVAAGKSNSFEFKLPPK